MKPAIFFSILVLSVSTAAPLPKSCEITSRDPSGLISSSCRTIGVSLKPGQCKRFDLLLPVPFVQKTVAIHAVDSIRVVEEDGRFVPLEEVYFHHLFTRWETNDYLISSPDTLKNIIHEPIPNDKYRVYTVGERNGLGVLHLIRLSGVLDIDRCIQTECPKTDPTSFTIDSAYTGPICASSSTEPTKLYYLEYNITYEEVNPKNLPYRPASIVGYDIAGGDTFDVPRLGQDTVYVVENTFPYDYFCPQSRPTALIRCSSHLHMGSVSLRVWDEATGELICDSKPVYGTVPGEIGNEQGFVVYVTKTTHEPPYTLQPGQRIRVQARYNATLAIDRAMAYLRLIIGDMQLTKECYDNNYSMMLLKPPWVGNDYQGPRIFKTTFSAPDERSVQQVGGSIIIQKNTLWGLNFELILGACICLLIIVLTLYQRNASRSKFIEQYQRVLFTLTNSAS